MKTAAKKAYGTRTAKGGHRILAPGSSGTSVGCRIHPAAESARTSSADDEVGRIQNHAATVSLPAYQRRAVHTLQHSDYLICCTDEYTRGM